MTIHSSARSHLHEVMPDSMGESLALGGMRLVVSPGPGRLRHLPPRQFHDGHEWVTPGQAVALLEQGTSVNEVRSPIEGRVTGFLVREGEPVQAGQPIVWLEEGVAQFPPDGSRTER